MIEPIMGEGGIKVVPDWCLKALRKLCNEKKILLILDEVQSGISRSGDFFAFEKSKVKPDIVPIAKGIGGGFPIGAVLMNKKVACRYDTRNSRIYLWRKSIGYGSWKYSYGYSI